MHTKCRALRSIDIHCGVVWKALRLRRVTAAARRATLGPPQRRRRNALFGLLLGAIHLAAWKGAARGNRRHGTARLCIWGGLLLCWALALLNDSSSITPPLSQPKPLPCEVTGFWQQNFSWPCTERMRKACMALPPWAAKVERRVCLVGLLLHRLRTGRQKKSACLSVPDAARGSRGDVSRVAGVAHGKRRP